MSKRLFAVFSAERLMTEEEAQAQAEKFAGIRDQVVMKAIRLVKRAAPETSDLTDLE